MLNTHSRHTAGYNTFGDINRALLTMTRVKNWGPCSWTRFKISWIYDRRRLTVVIRWKIT